jgi:hypothetical protein
LLQVRREYGVRVLCGLFDVFSFII